MILGSFSGFIFSFTALILGSWALRFGAQNDLSFVRNSGYLFWLLAILSLVIFIRHLSSKGSRIRWYRDRMEGCRRAGEYDWCIIAGKKAIAEASANPEFKEHEAAFHNQLGAAYFRKEKYDQAIREYTKAMECRPTGKTALGVRGYKLAIAYTNRAEAYIALGNYQAAIADCEDALQVDPTDRYAKDLKAEADSRSTEMRTGDRVPSNREDSPWGTRI